MEVLSNILETQQDGTIINTLLQPNAMRLMATKLNKPSDDSPPSPTRKPRFQRTETREKSLERSNLSISSKKSEPTYSSRQKDINPIQFVRPMVLDGSTYTSPLRHSETEQKLGLLIESRIRNYRREITPFKNNQSLNDDSALRPLQKALMRKKELQDIINSRDLEIAEMEEQNQKLKNRLVDIGQLEEEKRILLRKCERLEGELLEKQSKLGLLESSLRENEDCLTQTKTSLERLKKQIQENKINDLERANQMLELRVKTLDGKCQSEHEEVLKMDVANTKLQKEIEYLSSKIQKLEGQLYSRSYTASSMREEALTKEVQSLKEKLYFNREGHQKYLQEVIIQQKNQISELKESNKVLYIKLDVVVKKLHQKEKQNKKSKDKELLELQAKFRKFLLEYKNFRKEHNELLKKNIELARVENRQDRWESQGEDDQKSLNYSLTPERYSL